VTRTVSFSDPPSLSSQRVVFVVDKEVTAAFKPDVKEDNRCRAGSGNDEDDLLEEFKGALMLKAEVKTEDLYRCCPGNDEHINTVVVVAAAATAVDQILLRFTCMQTPLLEIILVDCQA